MGRYNFLEVRRACPQSGNPLPEDVNCKIEKRTIMFQSDKLSEMLKDVRINKYYGEGFYLKGGIALAEFSFQHGVCYQMKLIKDYSLDSLRDLIASNAKEQVLFKIIVKNEEVDMKRNHTKKREVINA